MELRLVSSRTPGDVRQVSYPDGVLLDFRGLPSPDDRTALSRDLTDLEVGERYTFYLQVFDPGIDGDPSEQLLIRLNDEVIWQRPANPTEPATWRYVKIDWVADSDVVGVVVERRAGSDPTRGESVAPVVRTLHLYPRY